jgi:hypothetical protein
MNSYQKRVYQLCENRIEINPESTKVVFVYNKEGSFVGGQLSTKDYKKLLSLYDRLSNVDFINYIVNNVNEEQYFL